MIDNILPPDLEQVIVDTIKKQCLRYREYEKYGESLFYEPYTKIRKKHSLTAAVLSGFCPKWFKVDGVEVKDLKYGRNNMLFQPELITKSAVIQIYSNGAKPLQNQLVQERCKTYNGSEHTGLRFLIIQFSVDKNGWLKEINAIYPDKSCNIAEKKILHTQPTLAAYVSA